MKQLTLILAATALAGSLAACSKPQPAAPAQDVAAPAPASQPAASNSMAGMDMAAGATMAKGTGTVTAINTTAGTITLDHGPIPEANWPAMTMEFKATPGILASVKKGDKVDFDLKLEGGAGEVTAVRKTQS